MNKIEISKEIKLKKNEIETLSRVITTMEDVIENNGGSNSLMEETILHLKNSINEIQLEIFELDDLILHEFHTELHLKFIKFLIESKSDPITGSQNKFCRKVFEDSILLEMLQQTGNLSPIFEKCYKFIKNDARNSK